MGDFEVVRVNSEERKNGGNVASYFCTPDGRVIHAVVGPVQAKALLHEAKWAVDAFLEVADQSASEQETHLAARHVEVREFVPMRFFYWKSPEMHALMAKQPLAPLEDVYRQIFQDVLGERVRKSDSSLSDAKRGLELAKRRGRPILFIFHGGRDSARVIEHLTAAWSEKRRRSRMLLDRLVGQHVVIVLPLRELPALSSELDTAPYSVPDRGGPMFVVADSEGHQLATATGWSADRDLLAALARGAVERAKNQPVSVAELRSLLRTVNGVDRSLTAPLRARLKDQLEQERTESRSRMDGGLARTI